MTSSLNKLRFAVQETQYLLQRCIVQNLNELDRISDKTMNHYNKQGYYTNLQTGADLASQITFIALGMKYAPSMIEPGNKVYQTISQLLFGHYQRKLGEEREVCINLPKDQLQNIGRIFADATSQLQQTLQTLRSQHEASVRG